MYTSSGHRCQSFSGNCAYELPGESWLVTARSRFGPLSRALDQFGRWYRDRHPDLLSLRLPSPLWAYLEVSPVPLGTTAWD